MWRALCASGGALSQKQLSHPPSFSIIESWRWHVNNTKNIRSTNTPSTITRHVPRRSYYPSASASAPAQSRSLSSSSSPHLSAPSKGLWNRRIIPENLYNSHPQTNPLFFSSSRTPAAAHQQLQLQRHLRFFSQYPAQQQRRGVEYVYRTFDGRGGGGKRGGGGGWGPGGGRFNRAIIFWGQYRNFLLGTGVAAGGFYVWNLDVVPMTGRRRFNCIPNDLEMQMGQQTYEMTREEYRGRILPESHPLVRYVDGVFRQLILAGQPQLGAEDEMLKTLKWKVHVIDSPEKNAFALPGGNVFVFTGILPICKDKDGLAAVLGHEIAHVLAHHPGERLSSSIVVIVAAMAASFLFDVSGNMSRMVLNLMLSLPNSRTQETEADEIGLMMMAKSCFRPEAAAGLWARMHQAEKNEPPQLLSTHPSSRRRMETIQRWLPQANTVYDDNGCGFTGRYVESFGQASNGFW